MLKFILKGSIGTVDLIEIQGALVEKTSLEAREKIFDRLNQGATNIILFCRQLKQIENCGVSLLIEVSETLQPRGGKLHFVNCPKSVMYSMDKLGMTHFFQFHDTEKEAFQALGISGEKAIPPKKITQKIPTQIKRQVGIKDHIRNKMILFKHNENAAVSDIVSYLQSTYSHFRGKTLEFLLRESVIPLKCTLKQLFEIYGYTSKDMLTIREIKDYRDMIQQGDEFYDEAI